VQFQLWKCAPLPRRKVDLFSQPKDVDRIFRQRSATSAPGCWLCNRTRSVYVTGPVSPRSGGSDSGGHGAVVPGNLIHRRPSEFWSPAMCNARLRDVTLACNVRRWAGASFFPWGLEPWVKSQFDFAEKPKNCASDDRKEPDPLRARFWKSLAAAIPQKSKCTLQTPPCEL
jgi:hypothetical protein